MKEPLLLPSSRAVIVKETRGAAFILNAAVAIGIVAVLAGAADVSSRLASRYLGATAARDAFAPAAALELPR
ncbi:MAG: hypothetical protein AAB964_00760 [Patescibacteria group bacterium]